MENKGPTEIQLKAAVLNRLVALGVVDPTSVVVNELPLGQTSVRADLVMLSEDNRLCGIEIKSDRDSLTRLNRQVNVYQEYFDDVIVVLAERHLKRFAKADHRKSEIWVARQDGQIELFRAARSVKCPTRTGWDLLTQKQAKRALYETDERGAFCNALRNRFSETSTTFWNATQDRQIEVSDLRLLSRFETLRVRASEVQAHRESMWDQWASFFATQNSVHSSSVS